MCGQFEVNALLPFVQADNQASLKFEKIVGKFDVIAELYSPSAVQSFPQL
jgi:hypothetical protein